MPVVEQDVTPVDEIKDLPILTPEEITTTEKGIVDTPVVVNLPAADEVVVVPAAEEPSSQEAAPPAEESFETPTKKSKKDKKKKKGKQVATDSEPASGVQTPALVEEEAVVSRDVPEGEVDIPVAEPAIEDVVLPAAVEEPVVEIAAVPEAVAEILVPDVPIEAAESTDVKTDVVEAPVEDESDRKSVV